MRLRNIGTQTAKATPIKTTRKWQRQIDRHSKNASISMESALTQRSQSAKNEMGYFVSYNDNPIALTSGRSFKELAAYVDGLRDMLLITPNK